MVIHNFDVDEFYTFKYKKVYYYWVSPAAKPPVQEKRAPDNSMTFLGANLLGKISFKFKKVEHW